jgi:phosphate starvation-inducible PhoH-like protein
MKMILTRFGFGSHMVVTGDVTQVDLPIGRKSGLVHAAKVLKDVPGISINYFDEKDVVRHEIVGAIIKAYEQFELKPDEKKAEE